MWENMKELRKWEKLGNWGKVRESEEKCEWTWGYKRKSEGKVRKSKETEDKIE